MKKQMISAVIAAAILGGCANTDLLGNGRRVPANPADFTSGSAPRSDEAKATSLERDNLTKTINDLRSEVTQLRQLFRLQSAPFESETSTADALAGPPAARPFAATLKPVSPQAAPRATATRASEPIPPPTVAAATPQVATAAPTAVVPPTYSALFKFASATLDDASRFALAALRPQLMGADKVSLSAFADTTGSAAVNAKLARARAAAVELELVKLGVPKERIAVSASVNDSKPPENAIILGLFRMPEAGGRRVDLALLRAAFPL